MSPIDEVLAKALPCIRSSSPCTAATPGRCVQCSYRPAVRAAFLELLAPLRGLNWRTAIEHTSECWQRLDRDCLCNYADRLVALDALIAEVNRG